MYDRQKLDFLRQKLEKWEETTLQQSLARLPERQDQFITTSSEPVERVYTPLDVAELDYLEDLGLPGEYPYTRGIHPTLYRSKLWTMRMFAGFGTAEETNQRFIAMPQRLWANLESAALPSLRSRIWKFCWRAFPWNAFRPA